MEINERIKNRRIELGLTQEELAKKLGYTSKTTIAKIEANANQLRQSKIKAIADALETTPSYIMGWDEEKSVKEQLKAAYLEQNSNSELLNHAKAYEELLMYFAQLTPEKQDSVINLLKTML